MKDSAPLPDLSAEDLRALAEQERRMDDGVQPFVVWAGNRLPVSPAVMEHLALRRAQSVSDALAGAIFRLHLEHAQRELTLQRAKN